jgi:hypothetical protein
MSERKDILTDTMRRLIEEQRLCYVARRTQQATSTLV